MHLKAWKQGLKGLYYLRTEAKQRAENVSEKVERVALADDTRTIVYGKDDCPYCMKAKLSLRGIQFDYINLKEIGKTAAEVTGRKEAKTVPQVYVEGNYVGGYDQLMEYLTNAPINFEEGDECRACEG